MPDQNLIPTAVHRPKPSATWKHEHRWGSQLGDTTTLRVTRTHGGKMDIDYGAKSIEIGAELVEVLAAMVAAAAAWTDSEGPEATR